MENGLFALAVWSAVAVGSASAGAGDSRGRALAGPILWVVAVWLRPEGLLAAALWHAARLSDPALPRRKRGAIVTPGMTAVALAVAGAVAFQYAITGDLLASSARSRVWLASLDSRSLGPFSVDARFALRLAAYAPLLVAAIVGMGSAFQRRGDARADWRFTVALLWGGFVLYTIVTGGAHLARYTIFLMPALCLLAGLGWESLARRAVLAPGRRRRLVAVGGLLALGVVFAYEARLRRSLGSPQMLRAAMAAPDRRVARTTDFLRMLETSGDRPVSVALVEVQLRYFLDGRVIVRSLDGRTDGRLLDFVSGTAVDYVGYLRDRGVDVVMEFPGRPGADGSLADLVDLPANGRVERGGLIFQRIGSAGAVRIVRPGA